MKVRRAPPAAPAPRSTATAHRRGSPRPPRSATRWKSGPKTRKPEPAAITPHRAMRRKAGRPTGRRLSARRVAVKGSSRTNPTSACGSWAKCLIRRGRGLLTAEGPLLYPPPLRGRGRHHPVWLEQLFHDGRLSRHHLAYSCAASMNSATVLTSSGFFFSQIWLTV